PASCSRSTPMICSSLNLLRFMSDPFRWVRIPAAPRGETRGQVKGYYNRARIHSALGYLTPEQAEQMAS
ncbi:hypothetical protein ACFPOC_17490, partial [Rubellimicrobium aerolatum]